MIFHWFSNNGRCYCHVEGWCYCPVYTFYVWLMLVWLVCDGSMVMYGGGVFQMLFKPLTKGSGWLSYILILTLHPITLVPVRMPPIWVIRSLSLGAINLLVKGLKSIWNTPPPYMTILPSQIMTPLLIISP